MPHHAHGKIILMGEHAVVYHHKALALPLPSLDVNVGIKPSQKMRLLSKLYQGELAQAPLALAPIKTLITKLKQHLELSNITVEINSKIPIEAGFGSSAAIAGEITEAMYRYKQRPLDETTKFKWIQTSETIAHGKPSGIDTWATQAQQALVYQKKQPPQFLSLNLHGFLLIGDTGIKSSTKTCIDIVAKHYQSDLGKNHIKALGQLSESAIKACQRQDLMALGRDMKQAQKHLQKLDLSTKKIDQWLEMAKQHALGAKISGAGRGGAIIALCNDKNKARKIQTLWQESNLKECYIIDLKAVSYESHSESTHQYCLD